MVCAEGRKCGISGGRGRKAIVELRRVQGLGENPRQRTRAPHIWQTACILKRRRANRQIFSARWSMKFNRIVRMQMMVMGAAAALFLANAAHAQQEVDPAFFDSTAGVAMADAGSAAQAASPSYAPAAPQVSSAARSSMDGAQQLDAAQLTPVDNVILFVLMLCFAAMALRGAADAISEGQNSRSRNQGSYSANGAIAH